MMASGHSKTRKKNHFTKAETTNSAILTYNLKAFIWMVTIFSTENRIAINDFRFGWKWKLKGKESQRKNFQFFPTFGKASYAKRPTNCEQDVPLTNHKFLKRTRFRKLKKGACNCLWFAIDAHKLTMGRYLSFHLFYCSKQRADIRSYHTQRTSVSKLEISDNKNYTLTSYSAIWINFTTSRKKRFSLKARKMIFRIKCARSFLSFI